jgi:hypothetical protein
MQLCCNWRTPGSTELSKDVFQDDPKYFAQVQLAPFSFRKTNLHIPKIFNRMQTNWDLNCAPSCDSASNQKEFFSEAWQSGISGFKTEILNAKYFRFDCSQSLDQNLLHSGIRRA